ncbi:MAG: type 4a pilus biogenesis protein PilO [Candidatus Nealsonbacteria bacterium]|nr:type 4a pilus biogenesis protein PilO [Candidatus Nealsonbacteria bacterium]
MDKNKKTLTLFFLATLIGLFVIIPLYQKYLLEGSKLSAEEEKLEIEDRSLEVLRAAEIDLREYQEELGKVRKALPDNPSVASVVSFIEERVRAHGLIFSEIQPFTVSSYPDRGQLKETIISLKIEGATYPQMKRFLESLEKSIKIIVVESISFELGEEERFSFDLTLKTYSY